MTTKEFLPIPPADTATDRISSPADLRQRWRALMGPLGFGESLLRFVFVGPDRRMLKVLSEVALPPVPAPALIAELVVALREVLANSAEGTTVAFLLTRPGVGAVTATDRRWSAVLTRIAAEFEVPIEPIFRANDDSLVLVEPG